MNFMSYLEENAQSYHGPTLIVNMSEIKEKVIGISKQLKKGVEFLLPIKCYSTPELIGFFSKMGFGFDVSNMNELDLVSKSVESCVNKIISFTGPLVHTIDLQKIAQLGGKTVVHIGNEYQLQWMKSHMINTPTCIQPIWGQRLHMPDLNNKGCDLYMGFDLLNFLENKKKYKFQSINLHNQNNKLESAYIEYMQYLQKQHVFDHIRFINLGGGMEMLSDKESVAYISTVQNIVGDRKIIVEAGDYWSISCCYLICKVLYTKIVDGKEYVFLDIVRTSQLKWSNLSFVSKLCRRHFQHDYTSGQMHRYIFVGCSCYQEIIAEVSLYEDLTSDDILLFSNINCYSIAWNHSFNGIEKLTVKYYE